jgi:type II restriction enzyme
MKRNYEYGIITDEKDLINTSLNDFEHLCTDESYGNICPDILRQIENILQDLPPLPASNALKLDLQFADDLFDKNKSAITENLSGWTKDVFIEVDRLPFARFTTTEVYGFAGVLSQKYPNNHHVEAKIRQQLQMLRDLGLIQFVSPGVYEKSYAYKTES